LHRVGGRGIIRLISTWALKSLSVIFVPAPPPSSHPEVSVKKLLASIVILSSFSLGQTPACQKNISFAVAEGGQIVLRAPKFTEKWIKNNQKKYPGLCFSQMPDPRAANYLFLFSTSQSAFNGFDPFVRTTTSTSSSPVYGSGTATDNYGSTWNYSYSGTDTTTITTSTTENVPYTITSNTLFLNAYDQKSRLISDHWRTASRKQGGDASSTLGYNLGSALRGIHLKEGLLKSAVEDVAKAPATIASASESATPLATAAAVPVHTIATVQPVAPAPRTSDCDPAIETNISGDFKGWDDETIYKMDNGQIWQQSTYHYHYHYAYHPSIVIYKTSSGACHARVTEDDDEGADVIRLK
jgi:hypothetical protein